ncbi:unnamed protein product (macronuclear) [Paramecium tetraurelia]|uniref:EF-hand domain-containing protein n=1 Tax=Paramecium tetraurelia TaxID=5888 RepID=A0DEM9_PARTE|nr:uncharacterized protein GSPATT00016322001 [Paramecium tetraurelia]CAK81496.1 unnamed protein product [Paramecium tetraurelia]|eukprot:XP_001448893.1 hypothetical protein (macronuclear) [Paramecium tetraurelia strain d4-2]
MKNKNKLSEESSVFRNVPTATQEQNTRRNSYSVPSNNTVIQQIFHFYTKQTYAIGVNATFDRQSQESNQLNLAKFFHFCRDFNIKFLNKQELQDLFKKCATNGQNINLQQFEQLFSLLALYRGIDLCEFYSELGFDVWLKNQKKMKLLGKPFYMKDDRQRFTKDELHYQFKLFHPDIKDENLIKEILRQRKLKSENNKNNEREKKTKQKLQFELKFTSGTELIEKYPEKIQLIQHLQKKKVTQHISNFKPLTKLTYSLNAAPKEQIYQKKTPIVTWDALNAIVPNDDLILSLIGPYQEEDSYLNQLEIVNNQSINQHQTFRQNNSNLSQKVRSMSDSNPNYARDNNQIKSERQHQPKLNYQESPRIKPRLRYNILEQSPMQVDLSNISNQVEKSAQKTKLNISILKRANEIQQLEGLKQKYLLDQILNKQLKKEQLKKSNVIHI